MLSKGFKEQAGKQQSSSIGNLVLVKLENKHALAVTRCRPPFRSMESNVCFLKSSKSFWFPLHCRMRLGWMIEIRSTSVFTPLEVLELTADFMKKPFRLLVKRDELSLHGIQQFCVAVGKDGSSRSNGAVSTVLGRLPVKLCEIYRGAMEIWHLVRHFRFSGHHPSCDFLHLGIILKIFGKTSQLTYWRWLKIRRSLGLWPKATIGKKWIG